jgi:catechol 2,3-dioxygenase-like lactoylglutathione lyase family enzyme
MKKVVNTMSHNYLKKIAIIEVPVSNLQDSIDWYTTNLGMMVTWRGETEATVELSTPGSPQVFLVQTDEGVSLSFKNSVIDFHTDDLKGFHKFLTDRKIQVTREDVGERGGFGFKDWEFFECI